MKIIFMGTPYFAVPCLESIVDAGHEISLVFTQPDKPKNRGYNLQKTPVKISAESFGLKVFQPLSLRKGEDGIKSLELIKSINPDCIVVAAYGQILPKEILDIPRYGCINVHASLLPYYRGAAPINYAIINDEKKSGISIQYMGEGIDTGDVILKRECEINQNTTATELHDSLMGIGADLITETLKMFLNNTATRTAQDSSKSTHAPKLTKELCLIDWNQPAFKIRNLIRGLSDVPGAFTFLNGKRLKIFKTKINLSEYNGSAVPGEIIDTENFTVMCGDKISLCLTEIQLEGGKRMNTETFLCGKNLNPEDIIGEKK